MNKIRAPKWWTAVAEAEEFSAHTMQEALEDRFDRIDEKLAGYVGSDPIILHGYAPVIVNVDEWAEAILAKLLESLDDDPEINCVAREPTDGTLTMLESAKVFVRAVLSEYEPTSGDEVVSVTVDLRRWIETGEVVVLSVNAAPDAAPPGAWTFSAPLTVYPMPMTKTEVGE